MNFKPFWDEKILVIVSKVVKQPLVTTIIYSHLPSFTLVFILLLSLLQHYCNIRLSRWVVWNTGSPWLGWFSHLDRLPPRFSFVCLKQNMKGVLLKWNMPIDYSWLTYIDVAHNPTKANFSKFVPKNVKQCGCLAKNEK